MSPSVRSIVVFLGAAGVVAMGWIGLTQILRADAFAKFKGGEAGGAEIGVTMTDVSIRAYEDGRLAAVADADQVEVRRDRSLFEMDNVSNGKFIDKDGEELAFDMKNAQYEYFRERLTTQTGAHVKGKDYDLKSEEFLYEKKRSMLTVNGKVSGQLAEGAILADGVTLDTSTRNMTGTAMKWAGNVDGLLQDGQRQEWKIEGKNWQLSNDGKTQVYTQGYATDGEIIIRADRVEYTKETDIAVAKGNVKYFGIDANMLCDEATIYRKEKRAVFTGVVRMVVKSKDDTKAIEAEFPTIDRITPASLKTNPQGATQEQVDVLRDNDNIRKYPIKVIADKVEYWYKKGERHAVITGSPFARQDLVEGWRNAWAVEALYDGELETLTLKSRPNEHDARMILSIGDDYTAIEFLFSTKEDDKTMKGTDVKATMFFNDDQVPTRNNGGGTGGTTGGGGGGTTGGR